MDTVQPTDVTEDQRQLQMFACQLSDYLSEKKPKLLKESVMDVLNDYFTDIQKESHPSDHMLVKHQYRLSYLFSLSQITPTLANACWSDIFHRLVHHDATGDMLVYERRTRFSQVFLPRGVVNVIDVLPNWVSGVALNPQGLIIEHAFDVAIFMDTLAHDTRLNMGFLIPTGESTILELLRASFEGLDLKPSSIDVVSWTVELLSASTFTRGIDNLKIPLFLLQLAVRKCETQEAATDILVNLITRIDRPTDEACPADVGTRYLVIHLAASAHAKYPGIFTVVLEKIFSKTIAMHIADSEGSINVEKILGNLAMLFEAPVQSDDQHNTQLIFDAFKDYIAHYWRQVLLLFLNHPSMECRTLGFRVLSNSRFWEQETPIHGADPVTISKSILDAWFRHMKHRYLHIGERDETHLLDELQRLIQRFCEQPPLAKVMLCMTMDRILDGGLEIFPKVDVNALQQDKMSLMDKIHNTQRPLYVGKSARPPQFVGIVGLPDDERDIRDDIYIDNIERTASLFYPRESNGQKNGPTQTTSPFLIHLLSKWPSSAVTMEAYDDALPRNIPSNSDILIGNAFKDHPALFLIIEKCQFSAQFPIYDLLRSILVYFIAFWHMKEVAEAASALQFATQLEETTRLILLMGLPHPLSSIYHLFPYMSGKDLGELLYKSIWPFVRCQSASQEIPGLAAPGAPAPNQDIIDKCLVAMTTIYQRRLAHLAKVPAWYTMLQQVGKELQIPDP
ncbi:uncharacterized protein BYT42DRAFT_613082 [Radiomyces spectabilis]|uniref:uncharacterized protein n=1 Tax=Radiomyces spectabilis TaxID=64574 RepID=UPI00221F2F8D|nr:uncharacterized protein BYT42DRAFT_613082 [Radiomyces spectabilis]KAI8381292.1 hypothetical protein BYT42DRAFT_613082 [Radiomyces spectabilis]